jgi:hypothetical protein
VRNCPTNYWPKGRDTKVNLSEDTSAPAGVMAGALYFHTSHSDSYCSVVLLDHLVGAAEQQRRHGHAQRARRLEVDRQKHLGWEFYRKIAGIRAA